MFDPYLIIYPFFLVKIYRLYYTSMVVFISINKLPNNISQGDKLNPKAAQALQEGLGGQFGVHPAFV